LLKTLKNRSYGEAEDYAVEVVDQLGVDDAMFSQFIFYPNPVESQLNLRAETPIEGLKVYNLRAQEVLSEISNSVETQLQTQSLPSGIYLMKVSLKGVEKTYRLIKK